MNVSFKLFGRKKDRIPQSAVETPVIAPNSPSKTDLYAPGEVIYKCGEVRCNKCRKVVPRATMKHWFDGSGNLQKGCKFCYLSAKESYNNQKEQPSDDIL